MMDRKRIIIAATGAAFVLAALLTNGFGLLAGRRDGDLTLYGNVDIREVDMAFRVSGRIASIAVEEGDTVRKGDVLAQLDTASLDSRIGEADARVAMARADLTKLRNGSRTQELAQAGARVDAARALATDAEQDYRRREPLVEPGAISRDMWAQTVAARDRARAQLAEAQQALALAREGARKEDIAAGEAALRAVQAARNSAATDLKDARLVALTNATVVTRAREPGAIVQPGETVLTLSIDRPLRVRAYVPEDDLSRVRPGMQVEVSADGNPKRYKGQVGHISPQAEFTPKSVETEDLRTALVYRLRIIVADPDGALRQGQPVTVHVHSGNGRD